MRQDRNGDRTPLVDIAHLTIGRADKYGRPILNAVDLQVLEGDVLGIVGESGSGKSTLALAMLGYLKPGLAVQGGRILVGGRDVRRASRVELSALRGRFVAHVPQNAGLSLTPTKRIGALMEEVLARHTSIAPNARKARAVELIEAMRLENPETIASRYPHELSGGQQQRCAVAIALASEPRLLVLDEPTSALDATTHAEFLSLLKRLVAERGVSIVCITHDMRVVSRLCSRIAVMYAGEVVEQGPSLATLRAPGHPYTQGLIRSLPELNRRGLPAAMPGAAPGPLDDLEGCSFAVRCPVATALCEKTSPVDVPFGTGSIRCHRPGFNTPGVTPSNTQSEPMERPAGQTAVVLKVEGLVVTYPPSRSISNFLRPTSSTALTAAVGNVSLSVKAGQVVGVIGESGSGKSTLLRSIVGATPISSGRIVLHHEEDLVRSGQRSLELRRRVQLVWQNPLAALNPRQTVFDAIAAPLRLYFNMPHAEQRDRAAELLDLVRLRPDHLDRPARQLSGGEAQRVAIARACAAEPDIMLCDEITSALDVSIQAAMLSLIETVRSKTGCAFLFVSHDLAVVRAIADEVVVLRAGEICESGPTERVLRRPAHPHTKALVHAFGGKPDAFQIRDFPQTVAS